MRPYLPTSNISFVLSYEWRASIWSHDSPPDATLSSNKFIVICADHTKRKLVVVWTNTYRLPIWSSLQLWKFCRCILIGIHRLVSMMINRDGSAVSRPESNSWSLLHKLSNGLNISTHRSEILYRVHEFVKVKYIIWWVMQSWRVLSRYCSQLSGSK